MHSFPEVSNSGVLGRFSYRVTAFLVLLAGGLAELVWLGESAFYLFKSGQMFMAFMLVSGLVSHIAIFLFYVRKAIHLFLPGWNKGIADDTIVEEVLYTGFWVYGIFIVLMIGLLVPVTDDIGVALRYLFLPEVSADTLRESGILVTLSLIPALSVIGIPLADDPSPDK